MQQCNKQGMKFIKKTNKTSKFRLVLKKSSHSVCKVLIILIVLIVVLAVYLVVALVFHYDCYLKIEI